jgi:predicted branched-subunit amino acid permease
MATVAPGMAAWGLMTGVATVNSGLSGVEVLLMTLLPYAGSSQLASLPLIAAGAPLWVVLATAFCVNLRFIVFSAHLRDYMMDLPLAERLLRGYVTADLSYMMMLKHWPEAAPDAAGRRQQRSYLAGNCLLGWISWIGASLLGVAFAASIPMSWGLGFAGTLALTGVLFSLANSPLRGLSAAISCAAAVAAFALPLRLNILVGIAAAVVLCLAIEQMQQSEARRGQP